TRGGRVRGGGAPRAPPARDRRPLRRRARCRRRRDRGRRTAMSPLPVGLLCGALLVGSVTLSNPFSGAACAAAAGLLLWAAPPPRAMYVWFAGVTALLVFAANPFVGVQGLTPLWTGP